MTLRGQTSTRAPARALADRMLEVLRRQGDAGATSIQLRRAGVSDPKSVIRQLQARGCYVLEVPEEIRGTFALTITRYWLLVDGSPALFAAA